MLLIPWTDCNDFKFAVNSGFGGPSDFFEHCKNAFDVLYDEGEEGSPKMMSVGLHCRLAGKPGRFAALRQFVVCLCFLSSRWRPKALTTSQDHTDSHQEYIAAKDGVWITTASLALDLPLTHANVDMQRTKIAEHFREKFPYKPGHLA